MLEKVFLLRESQKPPCHHQSDLREPSASKKYRRPQKVALLQIRYTAQDGYFVLFKNGWISELNVARRRNALEICWTSHANHSALVYVNFVSTHKYATQIINERETVLLLMCESGGVAD